MSPMNPIEPTAWTGTVDVPQVKPASAGAGDGAAVGAALGAAVGLALGDGLETDGLVERPSAGWRRTADGPREPFRTNIAATAMATTRAVAVTIRRMWFMPIRCSNHGFCCSPLSREAGEG